MTATAVFAILTGVDHDATEEMNDDRSVPVGFQLMRIRVRLRPADNTDPSKLKMLLAAAEYSCVVLQTLRNGVPVEIRFEPTATTWPEICLEPMITGDDHCKGKQDRKHRGS